MDSPFPHHNQFSYHTHSSPFLSHRYITHSSPHKYSRGRKSGKLLNSSPLFRFLPSCYVPSLVLCSSEIDHDWASLFPKHSPQPVSHSQPYSQS
ncbi:hypothetical protein E2C01_087580 [Portunus trituberculatus]|uniref:Uncharacterized protein n=1 Tax=Portunus trituberculatus TaxID=210409 RepID=A0A5B7JC41_PORTR|nr:hypothetical protein [Portunus trituberculatus]